MKDGNLYASELSTAHHVFSHYHFCRGNTSRRKTRIGIILKGSGVYIYLSKKLRVSAGDVVFIPENIYCYSEWQGDPEIEVVYISCFLHYDGLGYEPQTVQCDADVKENILKISELLQKDYLAHLEAYSLFYKVLQSILPQMVQTNIAFDKTLQTAIEYITDNWDHTFPISDVAKTCCVSESTLYHLFQKELGQTPVRFLNSIRINVAIEYLENSNYPISTISEKVGFNSENHFRKVFSDLTGVTPLKYKKRV